MNKNIYDALDSWREENGMQTTRGTIKHYEGGCGWDPTAEAIKAYMEEEKRKELAKSQDKGIER